MTAVFIFVAVFETYLLTVAPTMSFFDSGEMIAGAFTLGISHPPGYPVYITLGKLFTLLPFGSVAYRMNMMSGFFAAMASVMVYYITRAMLDEEGDARQLPWPRPARIGIPEAAGIFSALSFGLSYTLWAWAVASKFYTLNAFVVTCIVMLLIRWKRARADEAGKGGHSLAYLYLIAFICGIAGAVHISQFVLIPVYLLYILIVDRRVFVDETPSGKGGPAVADYLMGFQLKTLILSAFFFALGHSVYLHLPVRASQYPLIDWGGAVNWVQFKWTYNREGYGMVGGRRSLPLFFQQLKSFDMVREFGWAGLPLIFGGAYAHLRKDWRNAALLVAGSALMTFVVVYGGNPPRENIFLLEQFYIPVYIFLSVLMGGAVYLLLKKRPAAAWVVGLSLPFVFIGGIPASFYNAAAHAAGQTGSALLDTIRSSPYIYALAYAAIAAALIAGTRALTGKRWAGRPALYMSVFLALFILYPAYQLRSHYWSNDRHANFLAYDMGNAELTFAPQFTVLFTWGDSGAFPMWYLQIVERKRPDVLLVHTPHLPLDWFLRSIERDADTLGDPSQIESDYGLLRNYNGLKGIDRILRIPEDYREPSMIIRELVKYNTEREFAFDYSSRYSLPMPFVVQPYGIVYRKQGANFVEDNLRIWQFLVTRGLPGPKISLDLDERKAVNIYGFVQSDLGQRFLLMGLKPLAEQRFVSAVKYAPDLWSTLAPYMR